MTRPIVQWMPTRREVEPSNFGIGVVIVAVMVIGLSMIGSILP